MSEQYEKFEVIGRGRHSLVYEGHDHGPLDRAIAIKDLAEPYKDDSRRVQDFIGEARFLANLDYEHLLKIFDVNPDSNLVITELLEGSLDRLIESRGPMSSDRVRSVVQQVLKALNYLHKNNVLYGSLRPSKLLYSDRGKVKLGGFEPIQKDIVPKPEVEKYVAPETLDTEFGEIGSPLDFYCLGLTALELLLGDKFDQVFPVISSDQSMSNVGWLRWHSSKEELPPVKKLVPRVAADLAATLDAMLRKNVSERPQTAVQAISMLQDIDPIPVIEGVEQSIILGGHGRSAGRTKQTLDAPTASTELRQPTKEPKLEQDVKQRLAERQPKATRENGKRATSKKNSKSVAKKTTSFTAGAQSTDSTQSAERHSASQRSTHKQGSALAGLMKWSMAFVLLGGLGYGSWWTYTHDPMNWFTVTPATTPDSQDVAIQFSFQPDGIGAVQVTRSGEPVAVDSLGRWLLPPGDHQIEFVSGDLKALQTIRVDQQGELFRITLNPGNSNPVTPPEHGEFEVRFTVDPPSATLLLDDIPLAVVNGFAHARFPRQQQGHKATLRVQHIGYQSQDESIDLLPSKETEVRHVALNPLLVIEPADATVTLADHPMERTESGAYVLPRQDAEYDLAVSREGFTRFDNEPMTFDQLKARRFTIALQPDLDHIFLMGKKALQNLEFDDAIDSFSIVLNEDHAKYLTAYLLRGQAFMKRSIDEEDAHHAEEDLTAFLNEAESTASNIEKARAHWLRGNVHRGKGELQSAADDFRSSLAWQASPEVQEQLVGLLLERADQYLQAGRLDSAIADLEEVRELNPGTPDIDSRLAAICFKRGQRGLVSLNLGAARNDFDRAIELVADQAEYYVARGECRGRNSEVLAGIQDYTIGIELSDDPPSDWFVARGRLFRQDGQRDQALQDLNQAIELLADNSAAFLERARLYREDYQEFDKAITDYRSALKTGHPNRQEVQMAIGDTHLACSENRIKANDYLEAISQLRSALEQFQMLREAVATNDQESAALNTRIRGALRKLGLCFRTRSDWEQGIAVYTEAIQVSNNTDHEAYAGRGKCLKSKQQFKESELDLRKALQLKPDYNNARLYLAQLYILWGQERARSRFNAAPGEKATMKDLAVRNLRSAVLELENLIKADPQPRYYDLMVEAWKWLNVLDNSPENAKTADDWERQRQEFNANG